MQSAVKSTSVRDRLFALFLVSERAIYVYVEVPDQDYKDEDETLHDLKERFRENGVSIAEAIETGLFREEELSVNSVAAIGTVAELSHRLVSGRL